MVTQALIFLYLALYPLGQLPGFLLQSGVHLPFRIHITDLVVLTSALWLMLKVIRDKQKLPLWVIPGIEFIAFGAVIALIAPAFIDMTINFSSLLYPLRILSYLLFAVVVARAKVSGNLIAKSLIIITLTAGFLGWLQYLLFPDLTAMKYFGWDDHFYRMVGTFFDPAFLGMIFVLGILLAIWRKMPLATVFLTVSLAFTYSRASWLALIIGLSVFLFKRLERKHTLLTLIILFLTIPLLPRPGGEGVNLQRVNSIEQKVDNYEESFKVIQQSPLLGVGLNNICSVKEAFGVKMNANANSCSGLDNSLLFIFATTGVIGMFLFFNYAKAIMETTNTKMHIIVLASTISVFIHGMFTHTLFYPWVMGWLALLIGISRNKLRSVRKS
jgi:hypothetical protein